MPVNNPKKLNVSPNERIDIPDFDRAASDYSQELTGALAQLSQLDSRSRIYEGFRIEVTDQANGEITIYNGASLNADGEIVSDSSELITSTLTLAANSISYIEVEYVEEATDVDNRAFWDSTVVNASPIPDGGEFIRNTATRTTPGWRVVRPISTNGFAITTDPSSNKVPLALIETDGLGAIILTESLVSLGTVLEEDAAIGDTVVKVLDSQFLPPIGGDTQVQFVHIDPTVPAAPPIQVNVNDRSHGVLELAAALTTAYPKGSIVQIDPVQRPASFIPQRASQAIEIPFSTTATVAQPLAPGMDPATQNVDQTPKMFQGDEARGTALNYSPTTPGSRSDLELSTLKDYVDFLAGQLRELKFGNTDLATGNQGLYPGTLDANNNSIANFAATDKYHRYAGSLMGARSATVTIGDGVTSYGDFNGTDFTTFQNAINALPAGGGTIFIKNGTYTINGDLDPTVGVAFVGESRENVTLTGDFVVEPPSVISHLYFYNLTIATARELIIYDQNDPTADIKIINCDISMADEIIISGAVMSFEIIDSIITESIVLDGISSSLKVNAINTTFSVLDDGIAVYGDGTLSVDSYVNVDKCTFTGSGLDLVDLENVNLNITNTEFSATAASFVLDFNDFQNGKVNVDNCTFTLVSNTRVIDFSGLTNVVRTFAFTNNDITAAYDTSVTGISGAFNVDSITAGTVIVENNTFDLTSVTSGAAAARTAAIRFNDVVAESITISNCYMEQNPASNYLTYGIDIDFDLTAQDECNYAIKDNTVVGTNFALRYDCETGSPLGTFINTNLVIEGLTYEGKRDSLNVALDVLQYGIGIFSSGFIQATVKDCVLANFGQTNPAGFADESSGILIFSAGGSSDGIRRFNVINNSISNVTTTTSNITGIHIEHTAFNEVSCQVSGNFINDLNDFGSSITTCQAIYVVNMYEASVESNNVDYLFAADGGETTGIQVSDSEGVVISNNHIIDIGFGSVTAASTLYGIRVDPIATILTTRATISGNQVVNMCGDGANNKTSYGITTVSTATAGFFSVDINNNNIRSNNNSKHTLYAIQTLIRFGSGDISIQGNTISNLRGYHYEAIYVRGELDAIEVDNVTVSNNVITNCAPTLDTQSQGVRKVHFSVSGSVVFNNVTINGNTMINDIQTASTDYSFGYIGIQVNMNNQTDGNLLISGNHYFENTDRGSSRFGVLVTNTKTLNVTGNMINAFQPNPTSTVNLNAFQGIDITVPPGGDMVFVISGNSVYGQGSINQLLDRFSVRIDDYVVGQTNGVISSNEFGSGSGYIKMAGVGSPAGVILSAGGSDLNIGGSLVT